MRRRDGFIVIAVIFVLFSCKLPPAEEIPEEDETVPQNTTIEENSSLFSLLTDGAGDYYLFETNDTDYLDPQGYTLWFINEGTSTDPFTSRSVKMLKESGNSAAGYGLVFCYQEASGDDPASMLVILQNCEGELCVGEVIDGVWSYIVEWQDVSGVPNGYGVYSKVTLEYNSVSGEFEIYMNDGVVPSLTFQDEEAPIHTTGANGFIVIISPADDFPSVPVKARFKEID